MTKTELIAAIATSTEQPKTVVERILNAGLEKMKDALQRGEKVQVLPFGIFSVVEISARFGRNPRTGAEIQIPARRGVKFRASSGLKKLVSPMDGNQAPADKKVEGEAAAARAPKSSKAKQAKA